MSARIRIARAVWLATLLLAIPAAAVMFLIVVSTVNLSGHGQVSTTPILVVALVPAVAAAVATKLTASYVARTSSGQIYAGPVVLACAAGFILGWWLGSSAGGASTLIAIAIGSFAGAVAGTFVKFPVRPLIVGVAMAIFSEMMVLFTS